MKIIEFGTANIYRDITKSEISSFPMHSLIAVDVFVARVNKNLFVAVGPHQINKFQNLDKMEKLKINTHAALNKGYEPYLISNKREYKNEFFIDEYKPLSFENLNSVDYYILDSFSEQLALEGLVDFSDIPVAFGR